MDVPSEYEQQGLEPAQSEQAAFLSLIAEHRNQSFSHQKVTDELRRVLRAFSIQCTGGDLSTSDHDILELEKACESSISQISDRFAKLIDMARIRQKNLLKYQGSSVISLGLDCFSRTVTTRWGLKRSRRLGERSGPFDLSVHPPLVIEKLLLSGFAGYLDSKNLSFSTENKFCVNTKWSVNFNHEVGPDYANDDFHKLRAVYASRIASFNQNLLDTKPLLLVIHVPHFTALTPEVVASFSRVLDHIKHRRNGLPVSLAIINTFNPSVKQIVEDFADSGICLLNVELPAKDYVWFEPNCFLSDVGYAWESRICEGIESRLDELLA